MGMMEDIYQLDLVKSKLNLESKAWVYSVHCYLPANYFPSHRYEQEARQSFSLYLFTGNMRLWKHKTLLREIPCLLIGLKSKILRKYFIVGRKMHEKRGHRSPELL